jgi:hypothetical protein
MDTSRDHDLALLHAKFTNPKVPKRERERLHRKFVTIQSQVRDRKLTKLRYSLIQASRHGNADDVDKIAEEIKEYERLKVRRTPQIA